MKILRPAAQLSNIQGLCCQMLNWPNRFITELDLLAAVASLPDERFRWRCLAASIAELMPLCLTGT